MSGIEEKTKTLVLHLLGHQEKSLRAFSLKEKLRGLRVEEVAAILNLICQKASAKDPPYLQVYNALPDFLRSDAFDRELIFQLRAVARRMDYPEVLQILIDLPPQKTPPADSENPEDPFLKDLTLGHRKSLAKTQKITLLRKLLKDQDPTVIRVLLMNPRLTESEVLKIASLQPTSPQVLEEVYRSAKWISRYRVKKALVYNPYCPPAIAVHLLKFLSVSDLREVPQLENLHLAVKEVAHQLIQGKG